MKTRQNVYYPSVNFKMICHTRNENLDCKGGYNAWLVNSARINVLTSKTNVHIAEPPGNRCYDSLNIHILGS